jgi:hypothetical protein
VLTADPAQPTQVAAAIRRLDGTRVDVDLGEYALPAILDRYQRVYERAYDEVHDRVYERTLE